MATHSNRYPSPLSSRPINPNPRNPETNSTIRRSFSGNNSFTNKPSLLTNQRRLDPIAPANSPSDFGRRRSVGKDCEEKENEEKDCILKASKLLSPAKGCKKFMAPTISAASKFTPSPRKKVLVERNEPVRSSISISDGKAMFFSDVSLVLEPKNELGSHQNQSDENFLGSNLGDSENKKAAVVIGSHSVSKPCKKVTFSEIPSDSEHSVITDSDGLKVESKVVSSPIAPLDADPSLPPYDPKTNYLSPRPQFIHYKPNPRVEMLKEKTMDSDGLEDRLMEEMMMSEGFSDSDEAASDMVIGVDKEIEADAQASEPRSEASLQGSITHVDEVSEEEFVGSDGKKPRRLSRFMGFSMILVLLVACVSVYVTRDELFFKDLSLSDMSNLYEQSRGFAASARLSLGRVAQRVRHVAADSVSLVFKLANKVVEGERRAPLLFMNLTDLQESAWKEAYFLKQVENVEGDEFEEEFDEELDLEAEMDAFEEEEAYAEADSDDNIEKEYEPQDDVLATEENSPDSVIQTEMDDQSGAAHQNQETEVETAVETSHDSSAYLESEYSQEIQVQTEMVPIELKEPNSVDESAAATEITSTEISIETQGDINVEICDNVFTSDQMSFDMEPTPGKGSVIAVIIPCFIAGVVGVAALVYKRSPTSSSSNVVQVEPMLSKKRDNGDTVSNTKKHEPTQQEEYSESWQTESEMSSSYHYQRSGANEVESSEMKYTRRDSLASSSESPSYGSFTTYERIPIKTNGYGDEEIMTPVRRSSRIRKKVTST